MAPDEHMVRKGLMGRSENPDARTGQAPDVAVLFDMDGLLIDSEPLWLESERSVMARLAPGSVWTESDQAALLGGSLNRTVSYLLAHARRPAPPAGVAEWLSGGTQIGT